MTLYIDKREQKFIDYIDKNNLRNDNFDERMLDLGDFIIEYNKDIIFIERKTIADLHQSIVDGRYKNQKERIFEYIQSKNEDGYNVKVIYLLEGVSDNSNKIYWGAVENMIIRDNFYIIQTSSLGKTVDVVLDIYDKIVNKDILNEKRDKVLSLNNTSFKKSAYIDGETCYLAQLCQIPGVSRKIAEGISKHYNSFPVFVETFMGKDEKDIVNVLKDIVINEKGRKLGKVTAEKIVRLIFRT